MPRVGSHRSRRVRGARVFCHGTKVLLLPGANGKIEPQSIERAVNKRTDVHYPKPRALSLTQATEVGTVYSLDELRAVTEVARRFQLRVQMDGARFANAVAALGATPGRSPGNQEWMFLCFAEPRTALPSAKRWFFSISNWRASLTIAASKAGNSPRKNALSVRPVGRHVAGWSLAAACGAANAMAKRLSSPPPFAKDRGDYAVQSNGVFAKIPTQVVEAMHGAAGSFTPAW